MYERIILAADGSEESKAAVQVINKYIEHGLVKKLTILNVVKPMTEGFATEHQTMFTDFDGIYQIAISNGEKVVTEIREMIAGDIEIEEKVIMGDPGDVICEEAKKDKDVDLIIMGSRGRNPVKGLLLGSVSTRVLQFALCPVMIVKTKPA